MTRPIMWRPSAEVLAFVVHALRRHREWYQRNGMHVPAGVDETVAFLTSGLTEGHRGSSVEPSSTTGHVEVMKPKLVDYATASQVLACSTSSVKRLIKDGHLAPVYVGQLARLRVSDIEQYIDGLTGEHQREGAA